MWLADLSVALGCFSLCFLSAAASNMTDSNCDRPLGANPLVHSPHLTDTGASPQSSLALQANDLQFANQKSITDTDVSVTSLPRCYQSPASKSAVSTQA